MEHIPRSKIRAVLNNVDRHLATSGIVVLSIAPTPDAEYGVSWHQTIETRRWWIDELADKGFVNHEELVAYFEDAWVRGGEATAPDSFHLILMRATDRLPYRDRLPRFVLEMSVLPTSQARKIDSGSEST